MDQGPTEKMQLPNILHFESKHIQIQETNKTFSRIRTDSKKMNYLPGSKVPRTRELQYLKLYPEATCNTSEIVLIQFTVCRKVAAFFITCSFKAILN